MDILAKNYAPQISVKLCLRSCGLKPKKLTARHVVTVIQLFRKLIRKRGGCKALEWTRPYLLFYSNQPTISSMTRYPTPHTCSRPLLFSSLPFLQPTLPLLPRGCVSSLRSSPACWKRKKEKDKKKNQAQTAWKFILEYKFKSCHTRWGSQFWHFYCKSWASWWKTFVSLLTPSWVVELLPWVLLKLINKILLSHTNPHNFKICLLPSLEEFVWENETSLEHGLFSTKKFDTVFCASGFFWRTVPWLTTLIHKFQKQEIPFISNKNSLSAAKKIQYIANWFGNKISWPNLYLSGHVLRNRSHFLNWNSAYNMQTRWKYTKI